MPSSRPLRLTGLGSLSFSANIRKPCLTATPYRHVYMKVTLELRLRLALINFHSKTGASEYRSSRAMAMVYFSDNPQILYRAQTSAQLHPGHMICPGGTGTTTHLIQSAA